ncbi:hypothetical protein H4R24_004899 [Coemansia sp. RSA 988]|nr:hypothetical protein H4R24_004899 [Coemansia sp. RSA 988]
MEMLGHLARQVLLTIPKPSAVVPVEDLVVADGAMAVDVVAGVATHAVDLGFPDSGNKRG